MDHFPSGVSHHGPMIPNVVLTPTVSGFLFSFILAQSTLDACALFANVFNGTFSP